jgi:Flp pilus assembly pilin Flp
MTLLMKNKGGASTREYALVIGALSLLVLAGAVGQSGGVKGFVTAVRNWLTGL